jgi:hypothetical protein
MRAIVEWVTVALLLGAANPAQAETVASCGATKGHAFYLERAAVPAGAGGWTADGITQGRNIVTREVSGEYDLVFSDALTRNLSARAEGGRVLALVDEPDSLVLLVSYPTTGVTEVFAFFRERGGATRMSMQQTKVGEGLKVQKAALYVAECSFLR